jgi:predicted DNA-binding transcriptional regulator AlpA
MSASTRGNITAPGDLGSTLLSEYARKDELAQQFGVSERTIERWVRLRVLPAPVRLGRTSLYHLPTIQEHLAGQIQPERGRRKRR